MWYVYMLLCDDRAYYVGATNNLKERIKEHREGHSFFTKQFKKTELVYQEWHPSKVSAEKRENQLEALSDEKKAGLSEKR